MNPTTMWNLIYTGTIPQHVMRMVKTNITLNALSKTDSARMADYFLKLVELDKVTTKKQANFALQTEDYERYVSTTRMGEQYKYIHASKAEEILSLMTTPPATTEEVNKMLFKAELEKELKEISNNRVDVELRL